LKRPIVEANRPQRAKSAKQEGGENRADYSCGKQTPSRLDYAVAKHFDQPSFSPLSLLSPEVSNGPQINSDGRYGRDDYRIDGIDEFELVFSELSVVFMDTTTFRGHGGDTLGQKGHSKDYRPHLKQMVIGIIIDQNGQPVCSEMWPATPPISN
jgi:hypothetical protein